MTVNSIEFVHIGYDDLCTEIRRTLSRETKAGGGTQAVNGRIGDRLDKTVLNRGVGGYFVVTYNPVWGKSKHWGTGSDCMRNTGDSFRLNGYNIRFYYKTCKGHRCSSKLNPTTLKICWGCGVWYSSSGVEVKYRHENFNEISMSLLTIINYNYNVFDIY